eukprot:650629-Ditylum_brightwellii.AAC.1
MMLFCSVDDVDVDCDDNNVDDGDDDGVDDSDVGADKHLKHLSQGFDCHLTWKIKQNKHVVVKKDIDGDKGIQDGDDKSVEN